MGFYPVIVIIGACQPLGQTAAVALAEKGARVVVIDRDPRALDMICEQNPDWIEALAVEDIEAQLAPLLQEAWRAQSIDLVINLMPLAQPRDISAQMRMLNAILRTTLRGLVAGQGSLVSIVAHPADPLALVAQGMRAAVEAASVALAAEVVAKNVDVRCISLSRSDASQTLQTLTCLAGRASRTLHSTTFDLGNPAPD